MTATEDNPEILTGWGPIRAWFVKQGHPYSTKTLKAWRRDSGLPIHKTERFREVFAFPEELWEWLVRERFGKS